MMMQMLGLDGLLALMRLADATGDAPPPTDREQGPSGYQASANDNERANQ